MSSPSGVFSTLITSAPISASIKPQVGPAMTCANSITLTPASGPISTTLELRLALGKERTIANAEILCAEAGEALVDLGRRQRTRIGQPIGELLVPAGYQRRAGGDALRGCVGFFFHFVVCDDARDQTFLCSFLRAEHAALQQDLERHCTTNQPQQPTHFRMRHHQPELVDRCPEAARFPADPQVAAGGDLEATAHADALDHR